MKGSGIQVCLDSKMFILALILDLVDLGGFSDSKTLLYGGDEATKLHTSGQLWRSSAIQLGRKQAHTFYVVFSFA